ncbi:SPOR domain-containing protein [Chitinimonas sp. PSY-7]|uniref:SPOR domain-containing protein n=1 Tax=Chitinimonas sp. PSY-7 TaxID=3459088 RepID=UPI00404001C5
MKWLFVLLLIGNLLFYGYTQLETPVQSVDWRSKEINADQLKQIAFNEVQIAGGDKKSGENAPPGGITPPDAAPPKKPEPKPEAKPAASPGPMGCFAWHGLLAADLPNARKKLAALQLGGEIKLINNEAANPTRFWVYIAPRPSLEDAQKKTEELKALGISDFFVVNDGSQWSRAVSLGLYSTREAAQRRLETLRQQGVRSASMREKGEGDNATLMVRNVPKSARLNLGRAAMNFRGSSISEVDC